MFHEDAVNDSTRYNRSSMRRSAEGFDWENENTPIYNETESWNIPLIARRHNEWCTLMPTK